MPDMQAENATLRRQLERVQGLLRCRNCGLTPNDPTWVWCAWESGYAGCHYLPGSMPDLCGPTELARTKEETDGSR